MAQAKKNKKSNRNKKDEASRTPEEIRREIAGICLIAVGLLLGVSLYSNAVGILGTALCTFTFGTFGVISYALPVAFAIWGVLKIIFSEKKPRKFSVVLVVLFIVALLTAIHIGTRGTTDNIKAFEYYKDAYSFGHNYSSGGGIIGALLAYPLLIFIGNVGSYIILIAVMLIAFLLITKMSLKRAGEKVGNEIIRGVETVNERVNKRMETRKSLLYTEDLSEQEITPSKKVIRHEKLVKVDPFKLTFEDEDDSSKLDGLEILPSTGLIEKRKTPAKIVKDYDSWPGDIKPDSIENGAAERISRNAPKLTIVKKPAIKPQIRSCKDESTTCSQPTVEQNADEYETQEQHMPPQQNISDVPSKKTDDISDNDVRDASETGVYKRPPFDLLIKPEYSTNPKESPIEKARLLEETFATFGISAKVINYTVGPVITRFELQPAKGVRVNRIVSLSQDIALALAANRVRIEAPIPGKQAIGIEVPNQTTAKVLLREIVESREFQNEKSSIAFALGKDIAGNILTADLAKMPHLLIAGSTGSGKSVCINDIIISMIYKSTPDDLRMILIDPKVVEMRMYSALPHLILPVVTDSKKAATALKWAVLEMEKRYNMMAEKNARDLARYNAIVENPDEKLPKLVVVIDELADLMMVSPKDVEDSICRIAQLGRAAGIHLIVATQRPSADIITGLIKANISSRIAFMVSSGTDSRVILDESGAEKLLGKGDMLFHANGSGKIMRAQAALVTDEEVERIMDFFHEQNCAKPVIENEFEKVTSAVTSVSTQQGNGKQEDDLLPEAVRIVIADGQASISMIQRKLRVGYARAARLIDIMENMNIVSASEGSKPRKVLITHADYIRMFDYDGSPEVEETEENNE